ncbi:MAG: Rrf2 family transcriptional regulator [Candidatus Lambdaproteobacteria bacterium]|nr:Rrf2 family transcriptional regulator [Candidatus Lambdaproteobacteria bacterium]
MLKVNRKVEYGLVALKHMHSKPRGDLTSVREICETYGTPFDPVAHVLRILNSQGVVKSEQGAHGGYRLASDLREIDFARFVEMIEGQLAFCDCVREGHLGCSLQGSCNIVQPMNMLNRKLLTFLRSIKLVELLEQPAPWAEAREQVAIVASAGQ